MAEWQKQVETPVFALHHSFYVIWVKQKQSFKQKDYTYRVGHHTI